MDDPLADLARLLDRASVSYALIGGHAVNVWVEPRFTADVDVTVQAGPEELARLRSVLEKAGFVVEREHGAGLPSGPDFVRYVSADGSVQLEVQAAKTELQRELITRAITADPLRVATPEDLIVLKLIADRPKDRVDLIGLLALPSLDWAYIERWAREWDVLHRLARLRSS